MDRVQVSDWVAGYERVWRTPGTEALATIFSPQVGYRQGPYREPVVGFPALAQMWEAERDGADEVFDMVSEVVAVEGDTAVVRVEVGYGDPVTEHYRDLWILSFADDGRCRWFEEWPFLRPADDRRTSD
jgi:hypothetical protein